MKVRQRDGSYAIMPRPDEGAWDRLISQEMRRDLEVPSGATRSVLFGGPARLVEIACKLAHDHDPPAERLICHWDDYKAAGLARNGPMTFLAILPRRFAMTFNPPEIPDSWMPRKAILEPDPNCPRGEVRIVG